MTTFNITSATDRVSLYSISGDLKNGDRIKLGDTLYQVTLNSSGDPRVRKFNSNALTSFKEFFTHRLAEGCVASRADRINDILSVPAHQRHFRVDVDKNLLHRGQLPGSEAAEIPQQLNEKYIKVSLEHSKHGKIDDDGIRRVDAYVSRKMLHFLKQQHRDGAHVSIASTGGWVGEHLKSTLQDLGLNINGFYNKQTFNQQADNKLGAFNVKPISGINNMGVAQKYRVLGDIDQSGRHNIMLDDQWHQRVLFKDAINAKDFDMGPASSTMFKLFG